MQEVYGGCKFVERTRRAGARDILPRRFRQLCPPQALHLTHHVLRREQELQSGQRQYVQRPRRLILQLWHPVHHRTVELHRVGRGGGHLLLWHLHRFHCIVVPGHWWPDRPNDSLKHRFPTHRVSSLLVHQTCEAHDRSAISLPVRQT